MNGIEMPIVSDLSGAVYVCQLVLRVTCSHLKPADFRVLGYMANWASLLKDSLKAVWRWERRACRSPVWLCLIAKGDDGSGAPKSLHSFGTISWMKNTKEYYSYIVYVMFCMSGEG